MSFIDFTIECKPRNFFHYSLLKILSFVYFLLYKILEGDLYKVGLKQSHKSKKKVISVGNITVGGNWKNAPDWLAFRVF